MCWTFSGLDARSLPDLSSRCTVLYTVMTRSETCAPQTPLVARSKATSPHPMQEPAACALGEHRLPLPLSDDALPTPRRRCPFLDGFSLHANTRVNANDTDNLRRLWSSGARGSTTTESSRCGFPPRARGSGLPAPRHTRVRWPYSDRPRDQARPAGICCEGAAGRWARRRSFSVSRVMGSRRSPPRSSCAT